MKRHDNSCVLIFGDTHAPFEHKDTLAFLADISSKYKPDRVVCNGDLSDSYWFSQYSKDIKAERMSHEITGLRKFTKELGKIFPEIVISDSNHDARLWRKAKEAGIPREFIIPYMNLIGAEDLKGWKLVDDFFFTVDADRSKWQVSHWKTGTALTCSQHLGRNIVLSHHHSKQGIYRWSPEPGKNLYGADTGCLIDRKSYAFAYASAQALVQVTGAILIEEGVPKIIPLN